MLQPVGSASELGRIVQQVRRRQRIRQDDVAGTLGTSHVFIRQLEHGRAGQVARLFALLGELGIRVHLDIPDAAAPGADEAAARRRG